MYVLKKKNNQLSIVVLLGFLEGIKLDVNVPSAILTWRSQFLKRQFMMFLEVTGDMYLFVDHLKNRNDLR